MKLKELLNDIQVLESNVDMDTEVSGVAYDSRKVTEGCVFVAITGFASDGNRFIPMALQKGAAVVVTATKPQEEVPYVLVENDRLARGAQLSWQVSSGSMRSDRLAQGYGICMQLPT